MRARSGIGHQRWLIRPGPTYTYSLVGAVVVCMAVLMVSCSIDGDDHMGRDMMRGGQRGSPPAVTPLPTSTPRGSASVSYSQDVQPILTQNCVSCHGGSAGLWLDRYERVLAGSTRGPVVVAGNPQESELYRRITGESQPAMPLGLSPLSRREIDVIQTWISEGAANN